MIRPTGARALTLEDIDFDAIAAADVLHVGGADQLGDFVDGPLLEVIRHARANATSSSPSTCWRCATRSCATACCRRCREAQFFFPNEGQLAEMTGTEDPPRACARLRERSGSRP